MLGRRLLCLQSNIDRLSRNGRCYLWTFTLREAEDWLDTRRGWNRLLTYLKRRLPFWAGVRVYEVHPGRWGEFSHGLHVHVLCNRFHDVDIVRDAARAAGWGRIDVVRVRRGREYYVAKYLRKIRPEGLKGWRLHATFGMKLRTRLSDIVVHSARASLMRLVHKWHKSAPWNVKQEIVRSWDWKRVAGEWCAAVSVALEGEHRYQVRGSFRRWIPDERLTYEARDLAWPFMRRQSLNFTAHFDSLGTCWGVDRRRSDSIRDARGNLVSARELRGRRVVGVASAAAVPSSSRGCRLSLQPAPVNFLAGNGSAVREP